MFFVIYLHVWPFQKNTIVSDDVHCQEANVGRAGNSFRSLHGIFCWPGLKGMWDSLESPAFLSHRKVLSSLGLRIPQVGPAGFYPLLTASRCEEPCWDSTVLPDHECVRQMSPHAGCLCPNVKLTGDPVVKGTGPGIQGGTDCYHHSWCTMGYEGTESSGRFTANFRAI